MKEVKISRTFILREMIVLLLLIVFVFFMFTHDVPLEFILLITINVFAFNVLYVVKKIYLHKDQE